MAVKVLLREKPSRAIALATATHVLIFRHSSNGQSHSQNVSTTSLQSQLAGHSSQNTGGGPRCIVELLPLQTAELSDFRTLSYSVYGTLGLITVDNDVFLCVVSGTTRGATVRPGETVQKILSVDFYCLNRSDQDDVLNDNLNFYPNDDLEDDGSDRGQNSSRRDETVHPCLALKKLLSGGSFYYSADFDLTSRVQERSQDASSHDFDDFDKGYLWNSYMIKPLIDFRSRLSNIERAVLDSTRLLTSAIRGFALTINVPAASSPARNSRSGMPSTLTLISRLSCKRAGTRFNARGIDDDGNVANYVETETVFWSPSGITFSYVQVRGSVPMFWEQTPGLLPGQQKIQITRSSQATQPAFDKHFEEMEFKYGSIHVVNLLSKEKPSEIEVSSRYHNHIAHSSLNSRRDGEKLEHILLRETEFDFHAETRGPSGYEAASSIKRYVEDSADGFGYCLVETLDDNSLGEPSNSNQTRATMVLQQQGVFRTNCLDCLDRTNLVQTILSQMALTAFLEHRAERLNADLNTRHGSLWADNGDALSRIYAGTGALKSSFTRHGKMSLGGVLADARKSATRMYINNFSDKSRQNVMDMLLGRLPAQSPVYLFDPVNDFVVAELNRRSFEYTSSKDINIWAGTFNLNGRSTGLTADLSPWLCPDTGSRLEIPHIVAVGFQEIVELSPQQIMSTEPTRRQAWERAVKKTLNANALKRGSEEYVLLRGGQLVGACLSIFVKVSILSHIKNVEGSLKKTGLSGMAGNKGAVAIRLDMENTSICFVTAHLAAGFANYEERNKDYKTISRGLRFQRNKSIEDHDSIIWLGDFNYRIGLIQERVKSLASSRDFERLYENDQLNLQMVAGLTFPFYSEARITFMPTYKYDVGTDDYDSTEKARIPAWCDRVLRKGNNLKQLNYDSANLRFSDHRPVYATFSCTISVVDQKQKDRLSREIYNHRLVVVGEAYDESTDEDLISYKSLEPGLPPASSDKRKWWLENGLPARSAIQPPADNLVPNPTRPSNPFSFSNEPEWAQKPDLPERPRHAQNSVLDRNRLTTDTIPRKPAPPVPRKPNVLAASPTKSSPPQGRIPPGGSTQASLLDEDHEDVRPELPQRPAVTSRPVVVSELMDREDESGSDRVSWAPLQPS